MTDNFSNLVDTFKNVGVARAYGDPVQLGGQEVIPVALVSFGFGGGNEADAGLADVTQGGDRTGWRATCGGAVSSRRASPSQTWRCSGAISRRSRSRQVGSPSAGVPGESDS